MAQRVIGDWIDFYNTERPHSALAGQTPAEAYRAEKSLRKHGLSTDGESNWKAHAKYCVFVLLRRLVGRGLAARAVEQLMILDRQRFRMLRGRSRPVLPRSDNS